MRAVIQRVSSASVSVDGDPVASILDGLLVLVGAVVGDTAHEAESLADKVAHLRIMPDEDGKMNRSVINTGGGVLVVSQFTLAADTRRGRRPSFVDAADPEAAKVLIGTLVGRLESQGLTVAEGVFGATMEVALVNDGPVTIVLDTRD